MSIMASVNTRPSQARLTAVDLNLLVVFDALLRAANVSRAADELGSTQPSVSRALARLRVWFADPLFVRDRRGVTPTPRALALAPEVHEIVGRASGLLRGAPGFDPTTASREFRIMTAEYAQCTLLPGLLGHLAGVAPRVTVAVAPWSLTGMLEALEQGRVDLVLAPGLVSGAGLKRLPLFSDEFVTVVRDGHLGVGARLSWRQYAALPHLQVAPDGRAGGIVDDALHARGLARVVRLRVPSFAAAPLLVATTDLICTLPSRVRDAYASLRLRSVTTPLRLGGFTLEAMWHGRVDLDPAHRWLRGQVAEIGRALALRTPVHARRLNLAARTRGTL